jgi:hypothetical protein
MSTKTQSKRRLQNRASAHRHSERQREHINQLELKVRKYEDCLRQLLKGNGNIEVYNLLGAQSVKDLLEEDRAQGLQQSQRQRKRSAPLKLQSPDAQATPEKKPRMPVPQSPRSERGAQKASAENNNHLEPEPQSQTWAHIALWAHTSARTNLTTPDPSTTSTQEDIRPDAEPELGTFSIGALGPEAEYSEALNLDLVEDNLDVPEWKNSWPCC